jgi:3-keto-5-aminohexanoate cleavage enzyme
MQYGKLIINFAPTGMVPTKRDNPHVPITPDEIADDCATAAALGASILHLHARDADGAPTWQPETYRRVILAVRERCPDAIICVSTSGRSFNTFECRSAVLDLDGDAKPEMASLTLGSLNFPKQASVNEPEMIRKLAQRMLDRGIVPELEVFDLGMLDYARFLIEREVLQAPFYVNLLLGSLGTIAATPLNLAMLTNALPAGATWAGAGIGRFQFPINALAIASGGHVRVGLEDNLFMDAAKTQLATNAALVERVVRLAEATGRAIATPAEARRMIGLPVRDDAHQQRSATPLFIRPAPAPLRPAAAASVSATRATAP